MAKTQKESRRKVCVVVIQKQLRAYHQTKLTLSRSTSLMDLKFVCVHCHIILSQKKKNLNFKTHDISYEPNSLTHLLSLQTCTCHICQIVSANGLKSKREKGKRGRPSVDVAIPVQSFEVCSCCWAL